MAKSLLSNDRADSGAGVMVSEKDAVHLKIVGGLGFRSAHTLINKERVKRGRTCLKRSKYLDRISQLHAEAMAQYQQLAHAVDDPEDLKSLVNSEHAGENIQRGPSVEDMHREAMRAHRSAYRNILGQCYTEFGVGTCKGKDGKLYMVQLFRGEEMQELGLEDISENTSSCSSFNLPEMLDDGLDIAKLVQSAAETEETTASTTSTATTTNKKSNRSTKKPAMLQRDRSLGEQVLDRGVDIPAMLERAKSLGEQEGDVSEVGHGIDVDGVTELDLSSSGEWTEEWASGGSESPTASPKRL